MIFFRSILFSLCLLTSLFSDSIEITEYSSSFTVDTVFPEVELIEPGHGDVYLHGEIIEVTWIGTDSSPASLPVTINATALTMTAVQGTIGVTSPSWGQFAWGDDLWGQ